MYESFEKLATFLNEAVLFVSDQLLLRYGRYIAAGPSFVELALKGQELVVASLNRELAT